MSSIKSRHTLHATAYRTRPYRIMAHSFLRRNSDTLVSDEHITSSPRHSQSNGMSESAVKTAKRLVKRELLAQEDAYLSLLDLRNTPTQGMTTSPAERMLNRRTKTLLPTSQKLLQPKLNHSVPQEKGMIKDRQLQYYNVILNVVLKPKIFHYSPPDKQ